MKTCETCGNAYYIYGGYWEPPEDGCRVQDEVDDLIESGECTEAVGDTEDCPLWVEIQPEPDVSDPPLEDDLNGILMITELCPHGNPPEECNDCMVYGDFVADATREDRIFGRRR